MLTEENKFYAQIKQPDNISKHKTVEIYKCNSKSENKKKTIGIIVRRLSWTQQNSI